MKRRPILAVLCFAFGLILSSGSRQTTFAAEKLDKVRFTYAPLSASGFLWFIAKDAGYFEKNRLDVDMYFEGASPIMVQSILAGENQLAGGLGPTVVTNVLQGGDVIPVACITHTFTTPMYVQPSITSLQQLRGKKVGVSRIGAVSHLTADSILRRARVGDVTIIQTGGIPESMAAIMTGNVDGAMVNPPNNIILKRKRLSRDRRRETAQRDESALSRERRDGQAHLGRKECGCRQTVH